MKNIILIVLLLACSCGAAIIPGKIFDTNEKAITDFEKSFCVASYAKVGIRVNLPDGRLGRIKSLSEASPYCKDPDTPLFAPVSVPRNNNPDLSVPPITGSFIR